MSTNPENTLPNRLFLLCSAAILIVVGLTKVASLFLNSPMLSEPDPVFGLRNSLVLLSVSMMELLIGAHLLLLPGRRLAKYLSLLWLSGAFILYRISHWIIQPDAPCACLGSFSMSQGTGGALTLDLALKATLAFIFLGSCYFSYWEWSRCAAENNQRADAANWESAK